LISAEISIYDSIRINVSCSDELEHEVCPSFGGSDRVALTIWVSGIHRGIGDHLCINSSSGVSPSLGTISSDSHRFDDDVDDGLVKGTRVIASTLPSYHQFRASLESALPSTSYPPPLSTDSFKIYAKSVQNDVASASIFVSIPSYRDPECLATIRNLFITSASPSRVFVGVVSQFHSADVRSTIKPDFQPSTEDDMCHPNRAAPWKDTLPKSASTNTIDFNKWWVTNVRLAFIPASQATGPCFARHLAEGLWRREHYYMQIDSHMRFRQNWDVYLCALHDSIISEYHSLRPIITAYPMGYSLPNNLPRDVRPTILVGFPPIDTMFCGVLMPHDLYVHAAT
jgi:hypothetical protein